MTKSNGKGSGKGGGGERGRSSAAMTGAVASRVPRGGLPLEGARVRSAGSGAGERLGDGGGAQLVVGDEADPDHRVTVRKPPEVCARHLEQLGQLGDGVLTLVVQLDQVALLCGRRLGLLALQLPLVLAIAIPSRVRMRSRSTSNSANVARILRVRRSCASVTPRSPLCSMRRIPMLVPPVS